MVVLKGDFIEYGARVHNDGVIITVAKSSSQKNLKIVFFDKKTFKQSFSVELTDEYSIGLVYSVKILDIPWNELCYLFEADGELYLDPYATSIVGRDIWKDLSRKENEYRVFAGIDMLEMDWNDTKPSIELSDMVMYKIHMRGFTYGNQMSEAKAGNYKGIISKIPYFKSLNITTVEFMPIYDFEELFLENRQIISKEGIRSEHIEYADKVNYWGYGKANYFAPKASYFLGSSDATSNLIKLVQAFHKNNIEVVLEMSFGEHISDDLILDCLEYYVKYYHIDGFHIIGCNAPIERIADSAILGDTKIFYEFIPENILEKEQGKKHLFLYNDLFMDVSRQIQNHMNGSMVQFSNHMRRQNDAYGFVNYMSSVCGFSLWDSYSFGEKHNQDNGEENRDGTNANFSFNYGIEGKTANKAILSNRFLQMRNAFAILLLSQATPLIVAGDEVACTHEGNNNPYCQDNKIGYTCFAKTKNKKILNQFVTELIKFRMEHKCLRFDSPYKMNDYKHLGLPDMSFHGSEPWTMIVGEEQKALGVLYNGAYANEDEEVYVCYNFHYDDVTMALPLLNPGKRWRQVFNTSEYDENSTFVPKAINNQQSIIVPGSSVTVLVGLNP